MESSTQSCEMIRTVNVVTLPQWSQRHRGMEGWREKMCVHVSSSTTSHPFLLSFLLAVIPSLLCSLLKDSSPGKLNQSA